MISGCIIIYVLVEPTLILIAFGLLLYKDRESFYSELMPNRINLNRKVSIFIKIIIFTSVNCSDFIFSKDHLTQSTVYCSVFLASRAALLANLARALLFLASA